MDATPPALLCLLYTTLGEDTPLDKNGPARQMAAALVRNRLCACVHLWPMMSIYQWEGSVHDGGETALLCKTTQERAAACAAAIRKMHPYDCPALITLTGAPEPFFAPFNRWVQTQTTLQGDQDV